MVSLRVAVLVLMSVLLTACASTNPVKDHAYDYRHANDVANNKLVLPADATIPKDKLVIPNAAQVPQLAVGDDFEIPRAPTLFYPLAEIEFIEQSDGFLLIAPANLSVTRSTLVNFLTALHGEGNPIRSNAIGRIETVALALNPQSKLARFWSKVTRLYPTEYAFEFELTEVAETTHIVGRFRTETRDVEPSAWMSPVEDIKAHSVMVQLWGTLGRQLGEISVYLSQQQQKDKTAVWIDHRGQYVLKLSSALQQLSATQLLSLAQLQLINDSPLQLALYPESSLPTVDDIIDFTVPAANNKELKLFKVRRRHLRDIDWDQRIYPFSVDKNALGHFLVVDFSAISEPELRSFQLMSRFKND